MTKNSHLTYAFIELPNPRESFDKFKEEIRKKMNIFQNFFLYSYDGSRIFSHIDIIKKPYKN